MLLNAYLENTTTKITFRINCVEPHKVTRKEKQELENDPQEYIVYCF